MATNNKGFKTENFREAGSISLPKRVFIAFSV